MRISDWSSDVCSSDLDFASCLIDIDVRRERMARKAIFITGGGSGIGRAVARHFVGQSWFVGIADVNRAGIDETAALLPEGASSRHVMDVRDRDQWQAALDELDRKSTRLNSSH